MSFEKAKKLGDKYNVEIRKDTTAINQIIDLLIAMDKRLDALEENLADHNRYPGL
jgi:hypothetical protein